MMIEVEAGNTLSSIAAAHGADWRSSIIVRSGLASEGIDNITDISPGDQVILTDGMVRIIAGPADTLYGIGVANNIRWQDLIVLRQAEWQRGSAHTHVIGGQVLTAQEAGSGLLVGDRVFLPHFEGCQCGHDIPDGGATSAAEAGADATGETTGVEQTTQECDDDRTHFVIHSTSGVVSLNQLTTHSRYRTTEIMRDAEGNPVLDDNDEARSHVVSSRSKGHIYVFANGSQHALWPMTETNVWATKMESRRNPPGKGKMIHIELSYATGGEPTEAQYQTLANLYIQANAITCNTLVIVPHIEVDRGIPNGHKDPENFDYNHFYEILRGRGVAINDIERFDHDRYWGHPSYRVPWADDTTSWPPVLSGNPHS